MKKRKRQAHLNIFISKEQKKDIKYNMKQVWFTHFANCLRKAFGPRIKQKRKIYFKLERLGKVLCKN